MQESPRRECSFSNFINQLGHGQHLPQTVQTDKRSWGRWCKRHKP